MGFEERVLEGLGAEGEDAGRDVKAGVCVCYVCMYVCMEYVCIVL